MWQRGAGTGRFACVPRVRRWPQTPGSTRASLPGTRSTGADSRQSPRSCPSPPPAPEGGPGSPVQRPAAAFSGSEGCCLPGPALCRPMGQGWGPVTHASWRTFSAQAQWGQDRRWGRGRGAALRSHLALTQAASPACGWGPWGRAAGAAFPVCSLRLLFCGVRRGRWLEGWKILLSRRKCDIVPPLRPS